MAQFNAEQVIALAAIQQLINDWAHELDMHNGLHISELITEDCVYHVGGAARQGRSDVAQFYIDRLARLSAQLEGVPTQRHTLSNLRVSFAHADEAAITFGLTYYTTAGMGSGLSHADPAAVADVQMDCRCEEDGHWRIARFSSEHIFRRVTA